MRRGLAKYIAALIAAVLACGLLAACGSDSDTGDTGNGDNNATTTAPSDSTTETTSSAKGGDVGPGGTLTIPVASGWAEDVAVSNLWKYVLEQKGYKVKLESMDIAIAFAGVQKGDLDLFFDTWLPNTHKKYWDKIQNDVEDIGVWYDQATLNIAVPDYMTDINSIADLKGNADKFDGVITGIDPAAGETDVVQNEMMPQYDLTDDYTLQTSSSSSMLAALKKAIDAKKPIVVTLWHPHWAYKRFPIKDLKDPKGAMGGAEKIHVIGRDGFAADFPKLNDALSNFKIDDEKLGSLENVVLKEHEDDPQAGVKAWVEKNQQFVDTMTEGL